MKSDLISLKDQALNHHNYVMKLSIWCGIEFIRRSMQRIHKTNHHRIPPIINN